MNNMRTKTGHLWGHDWVTVPLVYTQVVTLLTHLFFITCLVGRQFLDPAQGYKGHSIDLYFPVYTFLQFFFFLGWLKVAEQLINPFGEDDDDFETNWFIDRNMQVCYAMVDEMYGKVAKIEKDPHWGRGSVELPYTEAALVHKIQDYKGSTMDMVVPVRETAVVFSNIEDSAPEADHKINENVGTFLGRCCCCCMPPLNKPLGESYGRTEPINFEQYDATAKRRGSTYSIFGDTYFSLINRPNRRDSVSGFENNQNTNETTALTMPNNVYIRRHRPSMAATQVLTSVSEDEQEEEEEVEASGTNNLKMALAFLDEDLEEVIEEK